MLYKMSNKMLYKMSNKMLYKILSYDILYIN